MTLSEIKNQLQKEWMNKQFTELFDKQVLEISCRNAEIADITTKFFYTWYEKLQDLAKDDRLLQVELEQLHQVVTNSSN